MANTERNEPIPIAVFVGSWLPLSETFVYDQLRWQRATRAWVMAAGRARSAAHFPYQPLTVLTPLEELAYRRLSWAPRFERALQQSQARVALAHFGLNGALATPLLRRLGIPLVVLFHGHDVGGLMPQNRHTARYGRYQRQAEELFGYASRLVCASSELAERLRDLGAPAGKLAVHELGVDLERFALSPPEQRATAPTVLMVGRLVEKKGMVYGLRAFARVVGELPTARLRVIGDGPLRARLQREVLRLGLQDKVTFLGGIPHERVRQEMSAVHVLLAPSVTTAQGDRESGLIVLKEAAALGIAAVATRHGGIPEIIDEGRTGHLVAERDVELAATRLLGLLKDPERARAMGRAAREKAEQRFDQRSQAQRLEQLLLEASR